MIVRSGRCSRQISSWCSECARTYWPISSISPLSSASCRNSLGASIPREGCCQRNSASRPVTRSAPASNDSLGWKCTRSSDRSSAWRSAPSSSSRSTARCARGLVEQLVARAAQLLGAVHRRVGFPDHRLRGHRRVGDDRDADADRHRGVGLLEVDRQSHRPADPLGDQDHLSLARQLFEQERELVATEPGDRVHRAQHRLQPVRQPRQQAVAGGVPERVVDLLEVVDVEEQDRDRGVVAARAVQSDAEAVEEQRPVGEPRERVVERAVRELRLQALSLDRVHHRASQQRRRQLGPDQVVLRAGLDDRHCLVFVGMLGEHDDRHVGGGRADLLNRRDPVLVLGQVEQHAARRVLQQLVRGVGQLSGVRDHQPVAPARLQHLADQRRRLAVAGHDQGPDERRRVDLVALLASPKLGQNSHPCSKGQLLL